MNRALTLVLLTVATRVSAEAPPPGEHRALVNLARSAAGDAYFELQRALDAREASWHDWATRGSQRAAERLVEPASTRESLQGVPALAARYQVDAVRLRLLRPVPDGAAFGLVELVATARLVSPPAALTLTLRHTMHLDSSGGTGSIVDVSPTPLKTTIDAGAPALATETAADAAEATLAVVHADLLQAVHKSTADPPLSVRVGRTQTQMVVAATGSDVDVSGHLVNYRQVPPTGSPRRLVRRLASGPAELPGTFSEVLFEAFEGAGGPFARVTLRPVSSVPSVPLTALVRAAGPEMAGSRIYDWSFMKPIEEIRYLKPEE